ncbi:16S rRNA pseudouridine(516) synthase RsuA [Aliidiomarina soli]|uniref:Pseudouridine synthase n=1 Tax=Aliidiomarina soli TaxID=1928574 RepID=A0A432WGK9_9GAMM|nr:16S rRNA pseudouridine(516) synthase RsuA [Aliidiomarina soli]RUO32940.1 16S rRNA pseudouridine(516) synthase RsuA [Aliidiomarina soli]
MRLEKFVSASTGLSRKEAGRAIRAEEVFIDGVMCKKAATAVTEKDSVSWLGQPLQIIGLRYLMLHKPEGTVSSTEDPVHPSVFMLLDEPKPDAIHCVGRLDVDTTGLLLLTDDGKWSHRITSPKKNCAKTYLATLADPLTGDDFERVRSEFANGVMLRGEETPTLAAQLEAIDANQFRLTLHEGRYHQVKRMFAAVGNKVVALHRESVGSLVLDSDLAPGEYRHLTPDEVASFD